MLKLTYRAMRAPANEVPPANADIAITRTISMVSMLGIAIMFATRQRSFMYPLCSEALPANPRDCGDLSYF
jgi:hypothetical protein